MLVNAYGLSPAQFAVADGCGLSRGNRIAPAALVTLLRRLAEGPGAQGFLDSLAVSGVDGTLRERLESHPRRVLGKTGTINGVATLAGYVLDRQGRPAVAFAILCNNTREGSGPAKALQDALLADWISLIDGQ